MSEPILLTLPLPPLPPLPLPLFVIAIIPVSVFVSVRTCDRAVKWLVNALISDKYSAELMTLEFVEGYSINYADDE
jgi:hypothetical protein